MVHLELCWRRLLPVARPVATINDGTPHYLLVWLRHVEPDRLSFELLFICDADVDLLWNFSMFRVVGGGGAATARHWLRVGSR